MTNTPFITADDHDLNATLGLLSGVDDRQPYEYLNSRVGPLVDAMLCVGLNSEGFRSAEKILWEQRSQHPELYLLRTERLRADIETMDKHLNKMRVQYSREVIENVYIYIYVCACVRACVRVFNEREISEIPVPALFLFCFRFGPAFQTQNLPAAFCVSIFDGSTEACPVNTLLMALDQTTKSLASHRGRQVLVLSLQRAGMSEIAESTEYLCRVSE